MLLFYIIQVWVIIKLTFVISFFAIFCINVEVIEREAINQYLAVPR